MKNKLKKYWEFFSTRTFEKGVSLEFFKDGSFAVVNKNASGEFKNVMEFYNDNCNHVGTLRGNDLRTLSNGITISVESDKIIIVANGADVCQNAPTISYEKGRRVFSSGSYVVAKHPVGKGCGYQIYMVCHDFIPLSHPLITDDVVSFEASSDNDVFAVSYDTSNPNDTWHICTKEKGIKTLNNCYRIVVLGNGSYLVHDEMGCKLYSNKNVVLCISDDTWGIKPLGHRHVCFENKFIVDADDGGIIAKASKDIVTVLPQELIFSAYTMRDYVGDTGYMLNGKALPYSATSRLDENLVVVYQQGTFYPFLSNKEEYADDCDDIYQLRLSQLYPGKRSEMYPNNWKD